MSNTTHAKHLAVDDALETHSKIIDAVWDEMPLFHSFEFLAMKLSDEEFCSDIADAAALAEARFPEAPSPSTLTLPLAFD